MSVAFAPAPPTLPAVRQVRFKADTFNIQKYGAVANGQTLTTQAFQKAITACKTT
jgi:DNA sulfur modification protein DndE